jgi:DNA-binding NarL/FixJ family response regulator
MADHSSTRRFAARLPDPPFVDRSDVPRQLRAQGLQPLPVRILLADDHALFREMLRETLSRQGAAYRVVGEAADGPETLKLVQLHAPDLLLLDYQMPRLGRLLTFCQEVRACSPAIRLVLLSGYGEEEVAREAARGGVHGYILKGVRVAEFLSALATVQRGGLWADPHLPVPAFHTFLRQRGEEPAKLGGLSRRELVILSDVARGLSNKEIGRRLYICQETVKNHLTRVFAKLGVADRRQAARYFLQASHQKAISGPKAGDTLTVHLGHSKGDTATGQKAGASEVEKGGPSGQDP